MNYCSNCGNKIESHGKFCSNCGNSIEKKLQESNNSKMPASEVEKLPNKKKHLGI